MVCADALARHRHLIAVDIAALAQGLDEQGHAPCLKHIFGHILAAWFQVGDVGRVFENIADIMQVKINAASLAMAGRCRPALVEPPVQATTRAAFSRLCGSRFGGGGAGFQPGASPPRPDL